MGFAPEVVGDWLSVAKATSSISSERTRFGLLRRLMDFILENAGARRAVLVRENEGKLEIEAEGSTP